MMVIRVESTLAAPSVVQMSRTIARASATPALAPSACTMRHRMTCCGDRAMAQPADPTAKTTRPARIDSFRPRRSLT